MRHSTTVKALLAGAMMAIASVGFGAAASASGFNFKAAASGDQEIQPPGGVVTNTTGALSLAFDKGLTSARFSLRVFDGAAITQAHLHCARAGVNGPIVAFLFNVAPIGGPGGIDVDGRLARGTLTNMDIVVPDTPFEENESCGVAINNIASLFAAIHDGLIYLNVHSEANPAGEVRGQIFAKFARGDDDDDDDDDDGDESAFD